MINTLGDLDKLLKLCRKRGVTELKLGIVELKLGELSQGISSTGNISDNAVDPNDPYANFPEGILTNEQLAFYSAGGDPSEDPFREPQ